MVKLAAWSFVVISIFVAGFQLAVAAGAPWGHLTQGGKHYGRLSGAARIAAVASALLVVAFAGVVLVRAGILLPAWQEESGPWAWIVVAFSTLTVLANAASRSAAERALWLPVGLVLLTTAFLIALSEI